MRTVHIANVIITGAKTGNFLVKIAVICKWNIPNLFETIWKCGYISRRFVSLVLCWEIFVRYITAHHMAHYIVTNLASIFH